MPRALQPLVLAAGLTCAFAAGAEKRGELAKGDTTLLFVGGAAGDTTSPTLHRLERRLASLEPEHTVVVFTGNYAQGELPDESEGGREEAEKAILVHVAATRDFVKRGGQVYFLPGHRDFAAGGSRAVQRLRSFLNHAFAEATGGDDADATDDKDELDVMPNASCGDPVEIELGKNLGLLLLNSQWWMQDWANDPNANQGCEIKAREAFQAGLTDAFKGYRDRRLVVAMHHPLQSYGEFGGSFPASAHLQPLPIAGSVWVLARQLGVVPQYENHPLVRSYLDVVLDNAQHAGTYVFASGHDANLQYLTVERQTQLVSGTSASRAAPTVKAAAGDFAQATPGWAELVIDPSGEGTARFISGDDDQILFQSALPHLPSPGTATAEPPPPFPQGPVYATYSKRGVWKTGPVAKFFIGSFYSDTYALELPWEPLDLEHEQGGLEPRSIGGGLQTNSLKVRDAQGADWVIRSVTKDPRRILPWPQNEATLINRMLAHGYTATHPEAALAVPRLADALGVLHATPRLMYLPDQQALGRYRGFIDEQVVLLERRPKAPKEGVLPVSLAGEPSPAGKTKFKSTEATVEKLMDKPSKHRVDQEAFLRARLLDILVADWDRHRDQWTWAVRPEEDGTKVYRPIPKDRDQVFANYDGLGLGIAHLAAPDTRKLEPFGPHYGSLEWLTYNARNIDPIFLNQIPHDRWMQIAREAQAAVTDQVIDEAFSTWHPEALAMDGPKIVTALRARRDTLPEAAEAFFKQINRNVDILGSNHEDTFELTFEGGGAVRVQVSDRDKEGRDRPPYFDRVFQPSETHELRLYALDGDDTLRVHGDGKTPIRIRFVGGRGNDRVVAAPDQARSGRLDASAITLYDLEDGASIDESISVSDERSNRPDLNQYDDGENHDPDTGLLVPSLAVNPDDGAFLGARFTYTVQGYKKHPFAARHQFGVAFATLTLGVEADYRALFPDTAGHLDQQVELIAKTPGYTRNFYGLTNQYVPNDPTNAAFYRLRQGRYGARYGLSHGFNDERTQVGAQLLGDAIVTEQTPNRFVSVSPDVTPESIGPRYFAGARLYAETNTFDDLVLPRQGVLLHASGEGRYDVVHRDDFSFTYRVAAAIALPFDRERRFVLLSRASLEGIVGNHPFYFAPTLGGTDLRAYHFQQLAGDVAFAQSTDLRIDVFRIHSGLPGSIGLALSADHGRVFGESLGNRYHFNYGAGVWWTLLDAAAISFNYFRGLDGASRFTFLIGSSLTNTAGPSTPRGLP